MDRRLYPPNWEEIATQIKNEANWHCEECGRFCKPPSMQGIYFLERIRTRRMSECPVVLEFLEKPGRFILTVAHLDHNPANCDRSNLKALCSVCHLRYDNQFRATKKRLKAERHGQIRIEGV